MSTFLLLKGHVAAHMRRTPKGGVTQVSQYERWSPWTGYTAGKGVTRWKTEAEAKKALAEAKKKLGKKYEFQLKPVAGASGKVRSWYEVEYRWPLAAPEPRPTKADTHPARRQPARPELKLVVDKKKLRASARAKEKERAAKEAADRETLRQAKQAGKVVKRFRKTPLSRGLEVLYKPEGAERTRVGTIKRVNKTTVVVHGRRRSDGTAPTYTVPLMDVMAYADYQRLQAAKATAGPYEVSERRTMARRQLTPEEGQKRKEAAEKRLGMTEDQIFTTPKVDGYITTQVNRFIERVSGLGPEDFGTLKSDFTVGMFLDLRRRLADPKTPAEQVTQFREHVQRPYEKNVYNPDDTSDLWWLAAKAGRKALIASAKQKREQEHRELSYAPGDADVSFGDALEPNVVAFLKEVSRKTATQATQDDTLEARDRGALPVLLDGFIDRLPVAHADIVRRVHALGRYANEREEGQTFQKIADAYRREKRPKYLAKYEWDRNHVGTVYRSALEQLRGMEGIEVLRSYVRKGEDNGLLRAIFGEPRSRLVKALVAVKEKLAALLPSSRARTLAVDFDGVIADYSRGFLGTDVFGSPIEGAASALAQMKSAGWQIVVHTAREITPALEAYLGEHGIPYDGIEPKILADVYLDDRAKTFVSWERFLAELEKSAGGCRLNGPLEACFPGARVLPVAWGTCIVEDGEILKSWSSDLQKKYPGGRWITVTDSSSPLHGRHIFILSHGDGTASVLVGGGEALRHKKLRQASGEEQTELRETVQEGQRSKPKEGGDKKGSAELSEEEQAKAGDQKEEAKAKTKAAEEGLHQAAKRYSGEEVTITRAEKAKLAQEIEAFGAKDEEAAILQKQGEEKLKKAKREKLQKIVEQAKRAVLEENPRPGTPAAETKEYAEEVVRQHYALQGAQREVRTLTKLLKTGRPQASQQSLNFEPMTSQELAERIADEKAREEELDAHYRLMATTRGYVEASGEVVNAKGDAVLNAALRKGSFEAFTGIIGEATDSTILTKKLHEELGAGNAAVLAVHFLGGRGKKALLGLESYLKEHGTRIVKEANAKGDAFLKQAGKVMGYGKGDETILSAAQALGQSTKFRNKAYEAYGQAEGAMNQAAELAYALKGRVSTMEFRAAGRDTLEAKAQRLGLSMADVSLRKEGDGYAMTVGSEHFEHFIAERPTDAKSLAAAMDGPSVEDIKALRANTDDFDHTTLPGIRQYTPPDAQGRQEAVRFMPHQQAAARLIAAQKRLYLNHEAGTGKSATVIAAKAHIEATTGQPCKTIVAMPSKLQPNFRDEIKKFSHYNVVIADGSRKKVLKALEQAKNDPNTIVVVSHDKMGDYTAKIRDAGFNFVVADEAHKITQRESRGRESQMSQGLSIVASAAEHYVAMSGTPTPSDLSEAYFHAHLMDPEKFGSQKEFLHKFGEAHRGAGLKETIGGFLNRELGDRFHTVKKDLGDVKLHLQTHFADLSQEQKKEYREISNAYTRGEIDPFARENRMKALLNDTDHAQNGKFAKIKELLDHHMATRGEDEKVIFYARNTSTLNQLRDFLKTHYPDHEHVEFTGERATTKQLDARKQRFKHDPNVKFSIHSRAGVEGLNLQYDGKGGGATMAIAIASGEDVYAPIDQFLARAYRTGAKKEIHGHVLLTDTPYDLGTELRLQEKKQVGELIRDKGQA